MKLIVDACVLIDCFQDGSTHRRASIEFLEHIIRTARTITMPAHGWFEVWCSVNRLSEAERSYARPVIAGVTSLPIELIQIDDAFIRNYGNMRLPHLRAGDHIYAVVAIKNRYDLVTRDRDMLRVIRSHGGVALTPQEFLARFGATPSSL